MMDNKMSDDIPISEVQTCALVKLDDLLLKGGKI